MGGFPCECCSQATCNCLTEGELPSISIPGYYIATTNIFDWQPAGDCCWKLTFYKTTTPPWTCSVQETQNFEWKLTCNTSVKTWRNYLPPVFQGNTQVPCPLPSWFCCPPDLTPVDVGTTQSTLEVKGNTKFFVFYRPWKIEVYLSRKLVMCGDTEVCKYILASRYYYEYRAFDEVNYGLKMTRQGTVINPCFSKHPEYDIIPQGPDSWGTRQTCEDIDESYLNSKDQGSFSFDRIRIYDTMPTGNVEFTNANTTYSLGCDVQMTSLCLVSFNTDTQVCIQSNPLPPCWCDMTVNPLITVPRVLPNRCNASWPPLTFRGQYYVYICDDGGPGVGIDPGTPTCVILAGGCEDEKPPCAVFDQQSRPINGFGDFDTENCNIVPGPDSIHTTFFDCGSNTSFAINQYEGGPIFAWSATCEPGNCNSQCCDTFTMDCPECEAVNPYQCYTRYLTDSGSRPMIRTITSRELTWNCSGITQRNVCINAPSWTLVIS